ncbi:HTH domain-containing protein [Bacillus litorisediminis]|uniref:HTH domain-containing protein n=1 Tax=Bacillus litorisediminis TaxID=2922713 RepID=UPI001FACAD0D|nr:HTH domain-containing protein [Bacillus litorisediminis]
MNVEGNGVTNVTSIDLRETLNDIINNFKISPESLSKITGVEKDLILDFANGKNDDLWYNNPASARIDIFNLIMLLSRQSQSIEDNERVMAVIQTLNHLFGISFETIALYANLNTEDVERFIHEPGSISIDKRFKLAVSSLFLHYICKQPEKSV